MDSVEQTMRFILDMEAKHEVWLQKHEEALQKHDESISRINGAIEANTARIRQLVDVSFSLAHALEETHGSIKELREAQREAQAATDYKLNALIATVDKLVRRNGGPAKP